MRILIGRMLQRGSVPRPRNALEKLLTVAVTFGLVFPLAPAVAAQGALTAATSGARESLASLTALLDPAEYDVDALGLELAFEEPETIASWVREHIDYEVYAGLLRGPQGTLVAGAGNALDQSVLLARLLGDAGYDARVALGTLPPVLSRQLVVSMFAADATTDDEPRDLAAAADALAAATGTDSQTAAAALDAVTGLTLADTAAFAEAVATARELLEALPAGTDADATDELLKEAEHYAWVEFRLGTTAEWQSAHPAWPATSEPPALTAERHLDSEVPAELQHRLRLEMTIERKRGDEFSTEALMTPWERPVANMLGHAITVGNTVLGETGATNFAELGTEVADVAFYAPVLGGSLAPGAMAFDLKGNLVPPDVAMTSMAGVFQTVNDRFGGAMGALGGMGKDEPDEEPFALTAQWLDIVLIAPGGEETRYRRTVFDRRAPGSREAGTGELLDESVLLDGIITTYSLMATGGRLSAAYVANTLAEQAAFHLDVIDRLVTQGETAGEDARSAALIDALSDYAPKDHLNLFAASDAVDASLDATAFRSTPAVLALVGTLTPKGQATAASGVDIIANAKRTVRLEGDVVYRDVEAAVLAGAWDTVVERQFVATYGQPVANATNVTPAAGWQLLTAPLQARLAEGAVPPDAVGAVTRELENGYAVLVPRGHAAGGGPPAEAPNWHYWRVDLSTGETLGMSAGGRGNAMAEFIIGLKVGIAVNTALAIPSLIQCATSGAPWTCYCDVIVSGAIFSFAGALFGALVTAESALLTYVIIDVAVVAPVTTLYTPPVCSVFTSAAERQLASGSGGTTCWAI